MDVLLLYGPEPFLILVAAAIVLTALAVTCIILHEFIVCCIDRRRFERENPDC